jgi:hypothetical protein
MLKAARLVALLLLSCAITGASFSGYMQKWGFRNDAWLSLQGHFDGTAERPFAYRRLFVDIADTVAPVPASSRPLSSSLSRSQPSSAQAAAADPHYAGRFRIVYALTFASLLLLLWSGYRLLRGAGFSGLVSYAASGAIVLLFPMIQAQGGYWYDFAETAFFYLFLVAAQRKSWPAMLLLAAIGAWNKESFLFFTLTAWPLVSADRSRRIATLSIAAAAIVAGSVYAWQRTRFAGRGGGASEFHLWDQLRFFTQPVDWLLPDWTYGLPLPHALGIVSLGAIIGLVYTGWGQLLPVWRAHARIAAAVNLPLFLLFCAAGEARNLSMLFPTLLLLIALALQQAERQTIQPVEQPGEAPHPAKARA